MEKLLPKDKENDEDLFNINEGMGKKLPLGAFIDGIPNDTHLNLGTGVCYIFKLKKTSQ